MYELDDNLYLTANATMSQECFQWICKEGKVPSISIKELFWEIKEKQAQNVYTEDFHLVSSALKSICLYFPNVCKTVPYTDIFPLNMVLVRNMIFQCVFGHLITELLIQNQQV